MTTGSEQRAAAGTTPDPAGHRASPDEAEYLAMQRSPEFQDLRRRLRRFVFPMTAVFLGWYLLYVLMADYAHDVMATRVVGNITVGLVFGLLQFVSTFVITGLYVRYANRVIDPRADRLRAELEQGRS